MKKAYVFPGQGSQYRGMGKQLYETSDIAKRRFQQADALLGFSISEIMFEGTDEDLKATAVTQPAIFLHSVILAEILGLSRHAAMVAGHSLGEFSALTAVGALDFADGLGLVSARAQAMQSACNYVPSAMAAILGLADTEVEAVCAQMSDVVVAANYNAPGQLVISGTVAGVEAAVTALKQKGAKMAKLLPVNGAFHSPLMEPARTALEEAICSIEIRQPVCPIYQNVNALPVTDPEQIRQNLILQLTAPVRWTQTIEQMIADGATSFTEIGPGKVLQGLIKRIHPEAIVSGIETLTDENDVIKVA
jgi:[acyl-carrier-protein] S-malonyltransferase